MKRLLLQSSAFVRAAGRHVKKKPDAATALKTALEAMEKDVFDPSLKTHKLKGELTGSWACSVDREIRIVFEFVKHEGTEAILLQTVGTHDEVY